MDNTKEADDNYQRIGEGEEIFAYGESAERIYLILRGLVGLFIKDENGQEKEIARLMPGHIFGELALLEDGVRASRALAHRDCVLTTFNSEELRKRMLEQPSLNEKLLLGLCKRIQALEEPIIELPEISELAATKQEDQDHQDKLEGQQENRARIRELDGFYLSGHGDYPEVAADRFNHYIYNKEVKCPVCFAQIEVKRIRNSRLRLQEIREDLRPIYDEFNPAWYKILLCPECFYAARRDGYFDLKSKLKGKIEAEFKAQIQAMLGKDYQFNYSEPRKLNEVFDAYYLSIQLYKFIEATADNFAYVWLRLSWLYEDLGEEELSFSASFKSMEYLGEFYNGPDISGISQSEENKITLLLSMLLYKHQQVKESISLLSKLVHNPQTKPIHKRMAKDRFIKIREEERKKKE